MKIRKAKLGDADTIADFNIRIAMETENRILDKDTIHPGVKSVLSDEKKGFYLVAEKDEDIIGQLMITFEWSDWRNLNIWWIQSVYVKAAFRQKGVYSALYSRVKQMAAESGVNTIRLYAEKENKVARLVYEMLGMEESHYVLYEANLPLSEKAQ